jgi:hypothetical protein
MALRLSFKIIHIMYSHTAVLVYLYGDLACGSVQMKLHLTDHEFQCIATKVTLY